MKRICFLLTIFLALGMASEVRAESCTPLDCVTEPCIKLHLDWFPETTCPGNGTIVDGSINNRMDCRDVFKIKFRLKYFDEALGENTTDIDRKPKWLRPEITVPLSPGASKFKFTYDLRIPFSVAPGKYTLIMVAEGMNSGISARKRAVVTVNDCSTPP